MNSIMHLEQENVAESSSSTGMKFAPTDSSAPFSASNSSRETHLKIAPVVPFDTDLKCWGADKISVASSVKYDSLHRFWKTSEHEETFVPPQVEASMRERRIVYESKFEPVTRMCGALLPSGRPCERMDRYKCPFHGPIVERDLYGTPVKPSHAERVSTLTESLRMENVVMFMFADEIFCAKRDSISFFFEYMMLNTSFESSSKSYSR